MAVREGMASLIRRLRTLTDAGAGDYTVVEVTYWSDEQLQDVLDGHRLDVRRERLMVERELTGGGTAEYRDFFWRAADVEEAASGAAAWEVEDALGGAYGTAGTPGYTPNYRARTLRMNADMRGTALYLSYRAYDLERAAAEVWETKAGHVAGRFDLKTDNHDLKRSQLFAHCLAMAKLHRSRAKARSVPRVRGDVNRGVW